MISKRHIPNLKPGEKIVYFLRRHWIIPLGHFLGMIVMAVLPYLVYLALKDVLIDALTSPVVSPIFILLASAYYLFVILFYFHQFVDYYLDIWMVTNKRILNIEQKGLFSRLIAEQSLERIQDVTAEIKGVLPTIFHYGNIYIQTAGAKERFIFKQVPNPDLASRKIHELIENKKKSSA